ncbi:MAG: hypothetical protein RL095_2057 [Verrucomicrobiota bacterium]
MDAKLIETLFEILMNVAVMTGLMQSPPRDLMSICSAEQVLEVWGQDAAPDALTALLEGRQRAPEGLKFDVVDLEKRLREGSPKERRKARAELLGAGEAARPLLIRLAAEADPELAEPARQQLAQLQVLEARKKAEKAPDLRPWAARRLGELRFQAARPVLEKLSRGEDSTLARESAAALRGMEGLPERQVRSDLPRLARALPPGICFGFAAELRRGASGKCMAERLSEIPEDKAPPSISPISPKLARQISRAVDRIGNFELHAVAFSVFYDDVSKTASSRLLLQGCFDVKRCQQHLPAAAVLLGGRNFHELDSDCSVFLSENLILAAFAGNAEARSAAAADLSGRYDQADGKAPEILKPGIALVTAGKARFCLAAKLSPSQRDEMLKGLADMRGFAAQAQGQGFDLLGMIDLLESFAKAKSLDLSVSDDLHLAGILHCQDAEAAGFAEASLSSADAGIRKSLATAALMSPEMQPVLSRIDLSLEIFSGSSSGSDLLFTCSAALPRMIFGGIAAAAAESARFEAELAAEAVQVEELPLVQIPPLPAPEPEPAFDP